MRVPFLLGRLVFGGYFVMSGINHFMKTRQMSQYAATKNVPKPDLAVQATGAMLIAGGTSTGRTATTNCEIFDSPDVRFCEVTPPFLTQLKVLGSYLLPYDVQISGTS